ncbi:hypothetical protein GCM10011511_13410 [Puia dinghuensis]|uniref:Uncharacterized protein n=2 Tax=Puia dinghuensis TaxID=1792502 RepID=A0A8J2XS09_9BACT|nr:hypothetical protein GCM10011511_13410 [Puia dinghuensis]
MKGPFSVRPICKETDRTIVRELFRQEFYGPLQLLYPDEGLWEIYDSMETDDAYGAYLVFYNDRLLLLLEVHPPVQMDLAADYMSKPGTIGIYCFYANRQDPMNLPAIRTCIDALLGYRSIKRIVTRVNFVGPQDPRVALLEQAGFRRLAKSPDKSAIYYCTQDTFSLLGKNQNKHLLQNTF